MQRLVHEVGHFQLEQAAQPATNAMSVGSFVALSYLRLHSVTFAAWFCMDSSGSNEASGKPMNTAY